MAWAKIFKRFYIDYIPRNDDTHADALTSFAATLALPTKIGRKIFITS